MRALTHPIFTKIWGGYTAVPVSGRVTHSDRYMYSHVQTHTYRNTYRNTHRHTHQMFFLPSNHLVWSSVQIQMTLSATQQLVTLTIIQFCSNVHHIVALYILSKIYNDMYINYNHQQNTAAYIYP